jgi:hypothetical protein
MFMAMNSLKKDQIYSWISGLHHNSETCHTARFCKIIFGKKQIPVFEDAPFDLAMCDFLLFPKL